MDAFVSKDLCTGFVSATPTIESEHWQFKFNGPGWKVSHMGKLISIMISIGLLILANQAAVAWRRAGNESNAGAPQTAVFHQDEVPGNSNSAENLAEIKYTNTRSNKVTGTGGAR